MTEAFTAFYPTIKAGRRGNTVRATTNLFSHDVAILLRLVDRVLHRQHLHLQRGLLFERRVLV